MALNAYLSIKGQKQGQIKGSTATAGKSSGGKGTHWIEVAGFEYDVEAQRDAASGLPTGKRQHKPFTVTTETSAASPQLLQAHMTKECLTEVVLEAGSSEKVSKRITLTNATLVHYGPSYKLPAGIVKHPKGGYTNLEFEYEKILVEGL